MELQQIAGHSYYQIFVQKLLSILLLIAIALSSVGMSVSQHSCSMTEEEIEASSCTMCSSEDHDKQPIEDEEACCSDEAVHLRLETDPRHHASSLVLQPLIANVVFELDVAPVQVLAQVRPSLPLDPATDPHTLESTVLRV